MSNYFADVSSNNGAINIPSYASSGAVALMIKATEGTGYKNPYYSSEDGGNPHNPQNNWARDAHRYGLPVFHYHFCRPENGQPDREAEWFWHVIRPHFEPKHGDHVVWDLETGNPGDAKAWVHEADRKLRSIAPVNPVCYTYLSYFEEGQITIPSKKIHIAAYGQNRPGNALWHLPFGQTVWAWQFTDGGGYGSGPQSMPGIGRTDVSLLNPWLSHDLHKLH